MADRRASLLEFGAWESFRSTLSPELREDVRQKSSRHLCPSSSSPSDVDEEDADGTPPADRSDSCRAWKEISAVHVPPPEPEVEGRASGRPVDRRSSFAAWKDISTGRYMTHFGEEDEKEEIEEIIELLALNDPKTGFYPGHWDEPGLQSHTKKAISAIFFAEPTEPRPELLKLGLVQLGGELRELMLFTNGFLFSRGDWDKFVRREMRDYFQGFGKMLNETALDEIVMKFDCHYDDTLTYKGFKEMMHDLLSHPKPEPKAKGISWWSLGHKIDRAVAKIDVPRKLYVAFQMTDIEKIETISTCNSNKAQAYTEVLAVHIKGVTDPLTVTFAHNRDMDAWIEAFAACSSNLKSPSPGIPSNIEGLQSSDSSRSIDESSRSIDESSRSMNESSRSIDVDGNTVESRVLYSAKDHGDPESTNEADESQLTEEEKHHNATWKQRFSSGSVFSRDYTPQESERKEMDAIIGSLALKNSKSTDPDNPDEPGQQMTKKAIHSIFFTEPGEPQSVLLKRGPVLLNGEERELSVFTHGFLFSNVELNSLASLLLNKNLTSEQMVERFREIDVDQSRELDRDEVNDFFRGRGIPLSKPALDHIMDMYDLDRDGKISWNEFKGMMSEMKERNQQETSMRWKSLRLKLMGVKSMRGVARKLDVAYQMTDIMKIENLGVCHSSKTGIFADSEWAPLTLAVHIKGKETPILVTCAKPGHVEAWMEAFRACITGMKSSIQDREESNYRQVRPDAQFNTTEPEEFDPSQSGMITGILEEHAQQEVTKRNSLARWSLLHGSAVNWEEDSEDY